MELSYNIKNTALETVPRAALCKVGSWRLSDNPLIYPFYHSVAKNNRAWLPEPGPLDHGSSKCTLILTTACKLELIQVNSIQLFSFSYIYKLP